jgi:hypothetical protein
MPDGVPMIPFAAEYSPPIGYLVPAGDYSAEMSDFSDTLVTFSIARDSSIFSYTRSGAGAAQADRIVCGDGFTIGNYDGAAKKIHTQAIMIDVGEERVFDLRDIGLQQNDSIRLEAPGRDVYEIVNPGASKEYNLGIRRISGAGKEVFEHGDIALPAITTHEIIPDWENLETAPVKIYIDTGNDGSIDDSIFVENEHTATLLQQFSAVFNSSFIEINWRLSEMDEGVTFTVLRAVGGNGDFEEMPEPVIAIGSLSFAFRDYSIDDGESYRYSVVYWNNGKRRVLFETKEIAVPSIPLTLYQNHPNPFNPTTRIRYYLPASAHVVLDIYDVAGRRIARLIDDGRKKGHHFAVWNGRNDSGSPVGSGVYFYRLTAGKKTVSRKMVLLR